VLGIDATIQHCEREPAPRSFLWKKFHGAAEYRVPNSCTSNEYPIPPALTMPNVHVPANAIPLPAVTRRQLLMGTPASAASVSAAASGDLLSKAMSSTAGVDVDDELIRLGRMFEDASDACDVAWRRFNSCEMRFFALRPRVPKALSKSRSPLGRLLPARNVRWTAGELQELLDRSADSILRNEVQTALPVAQAYEAEVQRLEVDTGLVEAEAAHGAAAEAVRDICRLIADTPARSVLGLAIKAHVVKVWGEPQWWTASDEIGLAERLTAEILDAVIATGGGRHELRRSRAASRAWCTVP
jgi:hypothetical protein